MAVESEVGSYTENLSKMLKSFTVESEIGSQTANLNTDKMEMPTPVDIGPDDGEISDSLLVVSSTPSFLQVNPIFSIF